MPALIQSYININNNDIINYMGKDGGWVGGGEEQSAAAANQ